MYLPRLDMVVEAGTTTSYALTAKIRSNMKIFAKKIPNDDYCMIVAVNFPTITLATIIYTLN